MQASDYGLSEEQQMIQDTVRKFATEEAEAGAIERDGNEEYPTALVDQMAELALFGIPVPEELGGAGLDTMSYVVAIEEIARADGSLALILIGHVSLGLAPITEFGSDAQKEAWIGKLAMGETFASFGLPGPISSESNDTQVFAERDGDGWVLRGSPLYVTSGGRCGLFLVPAVTNADAGRDSISIFLVPADADGLTMSDVKSTLGCRAADTRAIALDGVRVTADDLLGAEGQGLEIHDRVMDTARIAFGAMGVGIAQGALSKSVPYSDERHAFNKPLYRFDAIAKRIADIAMDTHAARLMVYHAARRFDAGAEAATDAALAKLYAAEAAIRSADHAIQVHGGYGYSREYHVERYYRDAKALTLADGTSEQQRSEIASRLATA